MSVQKVLLCAFHCKPKLSKYSLGSPRLENIPQVPGKRAEVDQEFDKLWLDFPELRGYIQVSGTLNYLLNALVFSEMDTGKRGAR